MAESHERFEELALNHVLGGLRADDAATFRSHLIECRECRMRVAELRDIAADLAATEREERRRAAIATEVERRADGEDDTPRRRWPSWNLLGLRSAVVLAVAAMLGLLFWNYHLRHVGAEQASVLARWSDAMEVLARGEPLTVRTREAVDGLAAAADDEAAVVLTDLPTSVPGHVLVVWAVSDAGEASRLYGPVAEIPGPVSFVADVEGLDELVVTLEPLERPDAVEPGERWIARIDTAP